MSLPCSEFLASEAVFQGSKSVSDIGGKGIWVLLGQQASPNAVQRRYVQIFLEENLETFIKVLKECLSFDLISWVLGINPKEIIR